MDESLELHERDASVGEILQTCAAFAYPVLVLGETGTGKTHIIRTRSKWQTPADAEPMSPANQKFKRGKRCLTQGLRAQPACCVCVPLTASPLLHCCGDLLWEILLLFGLDGVGGLVRSLCARAIWHWLRLQSGVRP